MSEMMRLSVSSKILTCMSFQKQFAERIAGLQTNLSLIETACNELTSSVKLKKVLKVILKVTNQLNADHEPVKGITIDSLVNLRQLKAQDKKTTVLQYVFRVIQKHDIACLDFTSEMVSLEGASRLTLDGIISEKAVLLQGHSQCRAALGDIMTHVELQRKTESSDLSELQAMQTGADNMSIFLDQVCTECVTRS